MSTAATAKPDLASALAADPGAIVETIAKDYGVTPRAVVEALPVEMRRFAPASAFVEAMQDIATWGEVTLIVHTDDGIMEFTGPIPAGEIGRGYFNLMGRTGFHGHLRHERCVGLAFVERPFMGRLSASILFLNVDGASCSRYSSAGMTSANCSGISFQSFAAYVNPSRLRRELPPSQRPASQINALAHARSLYPRPSAPS
jgi:putative heme utilization carrier protein HutX